MIMDHKFNSVCLFFVIFLIAADATDSIPNDQNDRKGRAWHHSLPGPQMLIQQHQQVGASTSQPGDLSLQQNPSQHPQNDVNGLNRNYEEQDKSAVPAASEQDFFSRHFGYLNVHRFDPNFPYYNDRNVYPRFPSPQISHHAPRFGPGYRKDKYGHGYGYSCKQGDDCDEVRAANQIAAAQPPPNMAHHHHHHNHGQHFGSNYPELPPFPSIPSFSSMPSFSPYGNQFGAPPARFNDPSAPPFMPSMYPSRFYQARYLHDEEDNNTKGLPINNDKGAAVNNKRIPVNNNKGVSVNNHKGAPTHNNPAHINHLGATTKSIKQGSPEDSQQLIDDVNLRR